MDRRFYGAIGVVVAVGAGLFVVNAKRCRDDAKPTAQTAPADAAKKTNLDPRVKPPASPFVSEPDVEGSLRLEGVVVDEAGASVAGAKVWMSSEPLRETAAEDDGSFAFDKLLGRRYYVTAQAGNLVGSAAQLLTETSPPIRVVVRQGQSLTVTVIDERGQRVAGADVAVGDVNMREGKTGTDGTIAFAGMADGWNLIKVRAEGFAAYADTLEIAQGANEVTVNLRAGMAVSGRVIDDKGAPVAGAAIFAVDAAASESTNQIVPVATSEASGAFTVAAVAPGSYRFRARHASYASATSGITAVDKNGARAPITITMRRGVKVAGVVVTAAKTPVPYAAVQLVHANAIDGRRKTTALADGSFEFTAVATDGTAESLTAIKLRAVTDTASSAAIALASLAPGETGTRDIVGISLVVDHTASISGVTVNAKGEAVAEATVTALPNLGGVAGDPNDLLAQHATTTSDGDGNFVLHGLADLAYDLTGSSSGMTSWFVAQQGAVTVKAGATGVRVVVPGVGQVKGKVAFANGGAPGKGLAQLGLTNSGIIVHGAFHLGGVNTGTYRLRVSGDGFTGASRDVLVKEGETLDVGTIIVERGRTISGVVRDVKGHPVAGATVYVGIKISATGTTIEKSDDEIISNAVGLRYAVTAKDGAFAISGIGPKKTNVLAEHALGRSDGVVVPAGVDDAKGLTLSLRAFGSMRGTVSIGGKPAAAQVSAMRTGQANISAGVDAGDDGAFLIDRLPEGSYRVTAQVGRGMGAQAATVSAVVRAGKPTNVEIDIPKGDLELAVEIKGEGGAKVESAFVFVLAGTFMAANGEAMMQAFETSDTASMKLWFGGGAATFEHQTPGTYTACIIALPGNLFDPAVMEKIQASLDEAPVHCHGFTLTSAPKQQALTVTVPPALPLP